MSNIDLGTWPVATARVNCGGELHTVRWEAGELVAVDHRDPEGERALAALGGTSMACTEILSAWARHRRDPRLLTICTRGPGDEMTGQDGRAGGRRSGVQLVSSPNRRPPRGGAGGGGWFASAPLTGMARAWHAPGAAMSRPAGGASAQRAAATSAIMGGGGRAVGGPGGSVPRGGGAVGRVGGLPEGLALLAGLGAQVPVRLMATVTAQLLEDIAAGVDGAARAKPTLEASLFGRASQALDHWMDDAQLASGIEAAQPDAGPAVAMVGTEAGTPAVRARLPLRWVADVWGRGMAVVAGRFAIDLVEATPERTVLETVGLDLGPTRRLTIELG